MREPSFAYNGTDVRPPHERKPPWNVSRHLDKSHIMRENITSSAHLSVIIEWASRDGKSSAKLQTLKAFCASVF